MAGKKDKSEAPAPEAEGGEEGAPKKKGLNPLILFGGLGAVILVLGGAAAFLLLGGKKDDGHAEADAEVHGEEHADAGDHADDGHGDPHAKDDHGKKAKKGGKGHGDDHAPPPAAAVVFYTLPDLLVNIQSDSDRPTYLKLKLTLELASADVVPQIEPAMPRVMDRFQSFLRELRIDDFAGSAGSYRLRLELLRRVNLAVAPAEVRAVLIEEMLIQ